jgi:hypothetical protein
MLIVVVVDSGNAPIVEAKDDRVLPLQRDPASLSGGAHGEEHSAGVQIVNLSRQEPKDTRVHRASEGELLLSCPSQDGRQTFLKAGEKQSPRLSELRRLAAQSGVRRRFAPHQLPHAHALELAREGVPLNIIQPNSGTPISARPRSTCKESTPRRSSPPSARDAPR